MRSDSHTRLPSADTEIQSEARWDAQRSREEILGRLGLYALRPKEGEVLMVYTESNEFRILKKLQLGRANVYKLAKSSRDAGHYSTILRALRRMERKRLVKVVKGSNSGERKQKVYEVTLLGELVKSLAIGGWKRVAEKIAAGSSKFQDCQKAHQPLDPYYYWHQAHNMIESLMHLPVPSNLQIDLDRAAEENECDWIKANVIEKLSNPQTRSQDLHRLEILSNVHWIKSVIVHLLDEYSNEWGTWLKTLEDFKLELTSKLR